MCFLQKLLLLSLVAVVFAPVALAGTPADQLAKQVTIHRDEWGVPHIYGETDEAVIFGVAYAQCEDYFWQVEDTYIMCTGRYGMAYGEDALQSDLVHALFEVEEKAKEAYANADDETKMIADAYAAGYNYFLAQNPDTDVRMIKNFEPHYVIQYERFMILQRLLGRAHAPRSKLPELVAEMEAATGSNAWAIAPSKTKSGNAMLFINPHQPWYGTGSFTEMHVRSDEGWNFSGSTFPGGPFPSMGHNEYLGWAHTVNEPDVGDVYRVTFDHPDNPLWYKYGNGYKEAEEWEKTLRYITDEGMKERTVTLRKTHHGPVMAKEDENNYLAVKIARLWDGNRTQQYRKMTKAKNFEEWYDAQSMLQMQMFNTVYADVDGNIF